MLGMGGGVGVRLAVGGLLTAGGLALHAAGAGAAGVTLELTPNVRTVQAGETTTLEVWLHAGAESVDAVDLFVNYPPPALQAVTPAGAPATGMEPAPAFPQVLANTIDTTNGYQTLSLGRGPADPPVTGDVLLATLRFRASAAGAVVISRSAPRASGVYVKGANLLSGATNASVTVNQPVPTSSGGGGGGGGGAPAPAATATPARTPTPAPGNADVTPPTLVGPAPRTVAADMAPTLRWQPAAGAQQFQLQVLPAANPSSGVPDGPALDLIISDPDMVAAGSFAVPAPVFGSGNYLLLPGMTYTWRVRTTGSATADATSAAWSPWTEGSFITPLPSAATLTAAEPANGSTVAAGAPLLRWVDRDPKVFYYEVQVSRDPQFTTDAARATAPVAWELRHGGASTPPDSYRIPAGFTLAPDTWYFWRVRPRVQGDAPAAGVAWSDTWSFQTPATVTP